MSTDMKVVWSIVIAIILGFIGYFKNIYELTECDFEAPYKCEAIHIVGLIPPIGIYTGYMTEDK